MATIEWLCAVPARNLQELESSNLASVRLRTSVGIKAALALGYKSTLSDGRTTSRAKHVVVGKIDYVSDATRPARWLQRLSTLKELGTHVIVDYTDHHLSTQTPAADFYRLALPLADTIVTSSRKLCEHVFDHTGRESVMIDDPIELQIQPPKALEQQTRTLLWFGHASNLPYLLEYLLDRYRSRTDRRLIIMTNLHPLPEPYIRALDAPHLEGLDIHVIPWKLEDMPTVAGLADVCIIPAGVNDPRKSGASANRLITALALGLPVAADQLDSYLPLKDYFSDLRTTDIDTLLDHPEASFPAVLAAQRVIGSEHTIDAAKKHWQQLLRR